MRYTALILFFLATVVYAHQPLIVKPENVSELTIIENPEISWAYYGELNGFPHTYEIHAVKGFNLYTQILEPDIKGTLKNKNGIIIRERDNGRGVEEVVRLQAKDAAWESYYEPFGGDSYLSGPEFEKEVGPGVYRIEVSTPTNKGKYVLSVGKVEDFSDVGYFETVARIYQVKRFFGKSPLSILGTPFVYVPLLIIIIIGTIIWYVRKRRHG